MKIAGHARDDCCGRKLAEKTDGGMRPAGISGIVAAAFVMYQLSVVIALPQRGQFAPLEAQVVPQFEHVHTRRQD